MKNRLWEIDFFKGIAILSVMLIHMSGICLTYPGGGSALPNKYDEFIIFNILSRFSVPGFIAISGMLLLYKYMDNKFSYGDYISSKLLYIGIPYLFWSIIYTFFWAYLSKNPKISIENTIYLVLHGSASYHLYFVIVIIQFYILYLLFRRLLPKLNLYHLFFILIAQINLNQYFKLKLPIFWGYNSVSTFLPWIFIFVFGCYIGNNYSKVLGMTANVRPYIIAGLGLSIIYQIGRFYILLYIYKLRPASIADGTVIILTGFLILLILSFSHEIEQHRTNIIIKNIIMLGREAYAIYLIHPIFIAIVKLTTYKFTSLPNTFIIYFDTILVVIASVISVRLIKFIKIGKYILGK